LLLIRKFHAPTVYGIGVLIFGAAGIGTAYATTYGQILALRLVLGAGEAVVQTSFVFLSLWYTRRELTSRAGE
jgi:MFS family permease